MPDYTPRRCLCWRVLGCLLYVGCHQSHLSESEMTENELQMKQSGELELLYKDAVDNIRLYKQQQFTITNYAIVLYGAIVALHEKFLENVLKPTCLEKGVLVSVSVVVLIVGSTLIFRFHCDMVGC